MQSWDIGCHSALRTQEPQGQAPSLPSQWFNKTEAAHCSQPVVTDNNHRAGAKVQLDEAGRSENFLVDTGDTYSVLTSFSRVLSSQTCTILVATWKKLQKDSPEHFVPGVDKYFPTSFWWSLSALLPFCEEIFPCLQNLAGIAVLIEHALKLSLGDKLFLPTTKWNNS